jgi:hypothetical protein
VKAIRKIKRGRPRVRWMKIIRDTMVETGVEGGELMGRENCGLGKEVSQ